MRRLYFVFALLGVLLFAKLSSIAQIKIEVQRSKSTQPRHSASPQPSTKLPNQNAEVRVEPKTHYLECTNGIASVALFSSPDPLTLTTLQRLPCGDAVTPLGEPVNQFTKVRTNTNQEGFINSSFLAKIASTSHKGARPVRSPALGLAAAQIRQNNQPNRVGNVSGTTVSSPKVEPAIPETLVLWGVTLGKPLPDTIQTCPVMHTVKFGFSNEEVDHKNGRVCIDRSVTNYRPKIWNVPYEDGWLEAGFDGDRVYELTTTVYGIACDPVYDNLEKKFGRPAKSGTNIVQNAFGAKWPENYSVWEAADGASVSYICSPVDAEGESVGNCRLRALSHQEPKQLPIVQP